MKKFSTSFNTFILRRQISGLKISFIGDLALNGLVRASSFDQLVSNPSFKPAFDCFVVANLETPIYKTGNAINPNKTIDGVHFAHEKVVRDVLTKLKIKVVNLANNHILDLQDDGLRQTIAVLNDLGIQYFGAGFHQSELSPKIIQINNTKVAFLGYCDKNTNPKIPKGINGEINLFDFDSVKRDLEIARSSSDFVICSIHWGMDYSFYPSNEQIGLSRELIDNGVDIIYSHHSHTIQPIEFRGNGVICYGLGGVVFGDYERHGKLKALPRKTKKGLILEFDYQNSYLRTHVTIDRIGNVVNFISYNYVFRNWYRLVILEFSLRFPIVKKVIRIKESFFDRVLEYFVGYYNNPLVRLLQLDNIKKVKILIRDYKRIKD